jgi:hypothetical protein
MSEKVALCDGKQMLERLLKVCDCQIFRFLLYKDWLCQAGKQLDVEVAVRMITLKIADFQDCNVTPDEALRAYLGMGNFVYALCATSEDAAKVLKAITKE